VGTRDVAGRVLASQLPLVRWRTARDDEVIAATMDAAGAAGLRYFDTAPFYGYGLAEHRLGQGLRAVARDDVVVATKVGRLFSIVASLAAQAPAIVPLQ